MRGKDNEKRKRMYDNIKTRNNVYKRVKRINKERSRHRLRQFM